jgi:2-polyprenyl-3-methyl-5-hydroxy-6-metoxy-1,4-benzoquinol methylase
MKNPNDFYQEYGEYNVSFNQLNLESPSVDYSWRKTKLIIEEEAKKIIDAKEGGVRIADFGCGNGALLIRLAMLYRDSRRQLDFLGIDTSKFFVDFAAKASAYKGLKGIGFQKYDLEKDELPGGFDVIICSEVVEHLQKPKLVLKKISQCLNPGGWLILSTPNANNWIKYPFLWIKGGVNRVNNEEVIKYLNRKEEKQKLAEHEQHINVYTLKQLHEELEEAGVKVIKTPRSSIVFGGPFLDKHPVLMAATVVADRLIDIFGVPQIGWDNIVIGQKKSD